MEKLQCATKLIVYISFKGLRDILITKNTKTQLFFYRKKSILQYSRFLSLLQKVYYLYRKIIQENFDLCKINDQ